MDTADIRKRLRDTAANIWDGDLKTLLYEAEITQEMQEEQILVANASNKALLYCVIYAAVFAGIIGFVIGRAM